METKDVIVELRKKNGLSQDELAEKVLVTRQAVSRWETGETIPNTETLKLLSKLFNVTINTLNIKHIDFENNIIEFVNKEIDLSSRANKKALKERLKEI